MEQHPELFDDAQLMSKIGLSPKELRKQFPNAGWFRGETLGDTKKNALINTSQIIIEDKGEYGAFVSDAFNNQKRIVNGIGFAFTGNNLYIFDVDKSGFPIPKYQIPINERNRQLIRDLTNGRTLSNTDEDLAKRLGILELNHDQRRSLLSYFSESARRNNSNASLVKRANRGQQQDREGINVSNIDGESNPDSKEYRRESARILREIGEIIYNARKDGTFMKAPNGETSNLDPLQWVMVRTKNFKRWFGDWQNDPQNASKVLDENGEPLVVHHYTDNENLSEFSMNFDNYFSQTGGTKKAAFFTEDNTEPGTEDNFLTSRKRKLDVFLNIRDLETYHGTKEDLHKQGTSYREVVNKSAEKTGSTNGLHFSGFDDNRKTDQDIWVIHDSHQVKSATDNNGRYSNDNPDIEFLKTPSGEVYGFVYQGEIYMDETKLDPQVPIHEYTHIWDEAVMQSSPRLWERGKRLLRDSNNTVLRKLWNDIAESEAYGKKWQAQGKTAEEIENLITGEVHARLVGEKGAELLEQIEKAQGGKGLITRLKRWMTDVFKHLAKTFGTWTDDALNELTLDDFINMPLRDFVDGVNPGSYLQNQNKTVNFDAINEAAESGIWTDEALNELETLAKQIEDGRHLPKRFSQRESKALKGILAQAEALVTARSARDASETQGSDQGYRRQEEDVILDWAAATGRWKMN